MQMDSTLRLFKALPITKKGKGKTNKKLLLETIKRGFIFSPEVLYAYSEKELIGMLDMISKEIGLSADKMNNAFHKSWKKIAEANIEQLVIEQMIHYITTYGYESIGVYRSDTIYFPAEKLKIPKIDIDKISLVVIRGYTKKELKDKLVELLGLGIALKEETKKDVLDVATFVEFDENEIFAIRNREVKCALYDLLDIFPQDPVEFLRFLIYKSTNKTLIIKNAVAITEIKSKDNLCALGLLTKYKDKHGLARLAEIFFRFKPLFLAFRTNKKLKSIINKIRKLADKHHKPMKENFLNVVTSKIKKGESISEKKLKEELTKVNVFRKIRLAYALKFRTNKDADSILYRVRNGKSYATAFNFDKRKKAQNALDIVIDSIVNDVKSNVKNKKIYIPDNIDYALPATEKQFTGDFPSGTCVSIQKDMLVGVHWENINGHKIDLDLSLVNSDFGKVGWDSSYRTDNKDVLFSGDVTDAQKPNGASELFYVKKQKETAFALMLNYFNHSTIEVPFKIIVGSETVKTLGHNYMINPNNVIAVCKSKITEEQKLLGLLTVTPEGCKFYFTETNIGNSITSYNEADYVKNARKYLIDFYTNTINLKDILKSAGAKFVDEVKKCDIDLDPVKFEKDTILKLLIKN